MCEMRAHAKHENFVVVVALGSCCYVSYFLYSDLFGAYSDDQFWLYLSSSPKLVEALIADAFLHGRPIGFFTYSAFFPILSLGGLSLVYLAVCAVLVLEASVVFAFFRQFLSPILSLATALSYLLFPPDAARFLPIHGLFSRFSAIAFWAAALCYLKRRPVLAAILSSSTMLIYETHLAQAALIPVLVFGMSRCADPKSKWDFQSTRKFFISFGLCSAALFAGRMILAPGRLGSPMPGGFVGILERLVSAGPYGVSSILSSHLDRLQSLATSFHQGSFSSIFVALSLAAVTAYCLHQLANDSNAYCNIEYRPALVLVGIGTVLMLVAYLPFALNLDRWPPTQIVSGRLSGVHLGAAIGYAVVWCGALQLCARRFGFGAVSLVTAAFVFCMSQYFISYQRMLVRNWDLQTTYWKQIQQCTREYKPRLLIIDSAEEEARVRGSELVFDWTTPYVAEFMWQQDGIAGRAPLAQTLELFNSKSNDLGSEFQLSSLFTWYLAPTEMTVNKRDIMLVKPLDRQLVPPSQELIQKLGVEHICSIATR